MPQIRLNGIRLHYEIEGKGPALLFIHGLGSSALDWKPQVSFFSKKYTCIAFDLRGHGTSEESRDGYTIKQFSDDAIRLLQSLSYSPAHLVGVSLGGMIAYQMAVDAPFMTKSITVVNNLPEILWKGMSVRLWYYSRMLSLAFTSMRTLGESLGKHCFPKPGQEHLRHIIASRWAKNSKRVYRAAFKSMFGWSVADDLSRIRCPVLMVASEFDYTPLALKERYLPRIAKAKLHVIRDARHAVCVEKPDEFNSVVDQFLTEVR